VYTKYLGAQETGKELLLYGIGNDALAPLKKQYIKGDLPKNNHFTTLQIDGQSPNLFYSNYITKTEKKHCIQ
jgi:hypothetical protein